MTDPQARDPDAAIQQLLHRPLADRMREHKYRFAQSMVFGLPVIGLEWFGHALGGVEAGLWVALFQALLAGWVMYVGATGMLIEGVLRLRRKLMADLLAAMLALGLYSGSLISMIQIPLTGRLWWQPLWFDWSVVVIAGWTGVQWWRLSRSIARDPGRSAARQSR